MGFSLHIWKIRQEIFNDTSLSPNARETGEYLEPSHCIFTYSLFNVPKFTQTTLLLRSLHWLPVAARIRFKTLVLAYRAANGSGPVYIQDMVKPYTQARPLRSASANRLVAPSLRAKHSTESGLFAVLAPKWWNELPNDISTAESLHASAAD